MQHLINITFIVPCYNRANTIAATIASIRADAPTAEIVVIDDGSTDDSWQVISGLSDIVAHRTENRGVSSARNTGIDLATRDYIRFVDSDDTVPHGSSEALMTAATTGEVPVGRADDHGYGFPNLAPGTIIPQSTLFRYTLPLGLSLIPRADLIKVGGLNASLLVGEDQELSVRLGQSGLVFRQIDADVYNVGHAASNRLTRANRETVFDNILNSVNALSTLAQNHADRMMLGQNAWALGREASRNRLDTHAHLLFSKAVDLAGNNAIVAPVPLKLLYKICSPYIAEQVLSHMKKAARL